MAKTTAKLIFSAVLLQVSHAAFCSSDLNKFIHILKTFSCPASPSQSAPMVWVPCLLCDLSNKHLSALSLV